MGAGRRRMDLGPFDDLRGVAAVAGSALHVHAHLGPAAPANKARLYMGLQSRKILTDCLSDCKSD